MGTDYHKHLASREWALTKRQVRQRSGGLCERCKIHPATQAHHLTYERLGRERLEDLQDQCGYCHAFVSGKSDFDPLAPPLADAFLQQQVLEHDLQPDILGPILAKGLAVSTADALAEWNREVTAQIIRYPDNSQLQGRLAQIKLRINQQFYNRKRAS